MRDRLSERVRQFRSKSRPTLIAVVALALLSAPLVGVTTAAVSHNNPGPMQLQCGTSITYDTQPSGLSQSDGDSYEYGGRTFNPGYLTHDVDSPTTENYSMSFETTQNMSFDYSQAWIWMYDSPTGEGFRTRVSWSPISFDAWMVHNQTGTNQSDENQLYGTGNLGTDFWNDHSIHAIEITHNGSEWTFRVENETGGLVGGESALEYTANDSDIPTNATEIDTIRYAAASAGDPTIHPAYNSTGSNIFMQFEDPAYFAYHSYTGECLDQPEPADDAELELSTRDYIKPNESAGYSVHFNDSGNFSDVTDSAVVTSNNTSVIVVNATENLLEAQPGVNTTVNVTAEYMASDGTVYQTTKTITVAQATVDNLEILPAIWRFGSTIGDDTIFFLIIAMLTGIVGTRLSTAFGGISLYWVVVMIGWFSGWLSLGILLVTTAMAVFIGLNLALTIDYGMRPGQG